jgi:hypothetical protein
MFNIDQQVWHNAEMRDRLGYYLVGEKKIYNKVDALTEFQVSHSFPQYIFNDEVFSKHNGCGTIEKNIFDLYKDRAKQLRDKYKTIVLSYSGGSDSDTILKAFQEADVPIDVILLIHGKQFEDSIPSDKKKTFNEIYDLAVPKINSNLDAVGNPLVLSYDMTHAIQNDLMNKVGENWSREQNSLDPTVFYMTSAFYYEKDLLKLINEQDKSTWCFIRGGEKPFIDLTDDASSYFIDEKYKDHTHWPNCELFFTTADMPDIHIKQEQILYSNIDVTGDNNFDLTSLHNKGIRDTVDNTEVFWHKTGPSIISPKSNTIIDHINNNFPNNLDHWKRDVQRINSTLDKRWFDNKETVHGGTVGIKSRGYRFNG